MFEEVTADIGQDTEWSRLCRAVWGASSRPSTLHDEEKAGLLLYSLTPAMLVDILLAEDQPLIAATTALINHALPEDLSSHPD